MTKALEILEIIRGLLEDTTNSPDIIVENIYEAAMPYKNLVNRFSNISDKLAIHVVKCLLFPSKAKYWYAEICNNYLNIFIDIRLKGNKKIDKDLIQKELSYVIEDEIDAKRILRLAKKDLVLRKYEKLKDISLNKIVNTWINFIEGIVEEFEWGVEYTPKQIKKYLK